MLNICLFASIARPSFPRLFHFFCLYFSFSFLLFSFFFFLFSGSHNLFCTISNLSSHVKNHFFLDVSGGALLGPLFLLFFFLSFLFLVFFFFWTLTHASDDRNSALSSDHLGPEHSQPSPPPSPASSRHVRSLRRQASSKAFLLCWAVPRLALFVVAPWRTSSGARRGLVGCRLCPG